MQIITPVNNNYYYLENVIKRSTFCHQNPRLPCKVCQMIAIITKTFEGIIVTIQQKTASVHSNPQVQRLYQYSRTAGSLDSKYIFIRPILRSMRRHYISRCLSVIQWQSKISLGDRSTSRRGTLDDVLPRPCLPGHFGLYDSAPRQVAWADFFFSWSVQWTNESLSIIINKLLNYYKIN